MVTLRPRTLALPWGDGEGVPEIASKVPILPNRGRVRRMRGRWVPNGGAVYHATRGSTLYGGAMNEDVPDLSANARGVPSIGGVYIA